MTAKTPDRKPGSRAAGRSLPGARESGAGDQFHLLYAARRAIALLDPASDLQRIRLEGLSPEEPASDAADLLLGIDLVEYYGGETFAAADYVVVSQMKYSQRNPEKAWTAARLCESSRKNGPSVISRLAESFAAFSSTHPRAEVLQKLRLRLVSNQPAGPAVQDALASAQALVRSGSVAMTSELLSAGLARQYAADIERLVKCAGLPETALPDFLRLLDISECGADARSVQEAQLARDLRRHLPGNAEAALDRVYRRIEREVLPETEDSPGLTKADILVWFDIDSERELFPVPTKFELPERVIPTPDLERMAAAAQDASEGFVLSHGEAGVGKTTTLMELEAVLPAGSIVIPYDCFGGGAYLDPSEGRHRPERAIYQLVNELALRCGTPLLLRTTPLVADLWMVFRERLGEAAAALADGRLLVIAVDAADNAVFAARQVGEQCFVPSLWHMPLPANARVVVTARTHRIGELNAPDPVTEVQLQGFDLAASRIHLQERFTDASHIDVSTFHGATGGNPRVQFYVLDRERAPKLTLAQALADAQRTPEEIFDDLVKAAIRETADPQQAMRRVADLVCLVRPARIATFAAATGMTLDEAKRFCHGLAPGIVIYDGAVSFRDEDFEKHLRAIVGEEAQVEAHQRLAAHFMKYEREDPEAATAIAEHLFRGRDFEKLVSLALERGEPHAITDPVVRLQVYQRRLAFALRAALETGALAEAVRLTLLVAEAARSGSAVEAVVRERPDLAMRHGDPAGVADIYLQQASEPWRGPLHLQIAAMFGREGESGEAAEHYVLAQAWLRERSARMDAGEPSWELTLDDLAAGAEIFYWREGLQAAIDWLHRWRPPEAVFGATTRLAERLAKAGEGERLLRQVEAARLDIRSQSAFLAALWWRGVGIPTEVARALTPRLDRAVRRQPAADREPPWDAPNPADTWTIRFAELAAARRADPKELNALLRRAASAPPQHSLSSWDDMRRHDPALRRAALEAVIEGRELTSDELVPEQLRPDPNAKNAYDARASDRREFTEVLGSVLPAYMLRARVIARATRFASIAPELQRQLAAKRSGAEARWAKFDRRFALWANVVADAALRATGGDPSQFLLDVADVAERAVRAAAPDSWLDLAELALRHKKTTDAGLRLADRAAVWVETNDLPATNRTQTLLRAAALLDMVDDDLAHDYYERAITAAAGIDDEAIGVLELHARIAREIDGDDATRASLGHRMVSLVEAFADKVTDTERLPYAATLRGVAALHPPTALATASRWDDEERHGIPDSIEPVAIGAMEAGFLNPSDTLPLLNLGGERFDIASASTPILEHLRQGNTGSVRTLRRAVAYVAHWIERDLPLEGRPRLAAEFVSWADAAGLGALEGIEQLRAMAEHATASDPADGEPAFTVKASSEPRVEDVPIDVGAAGINNALDELVSRYATDDEIAAYIIEAGRSVAPTKRTEFLDTLVELPTGNRAIRWHPEALIRGLGNLLAEWRTSGLVRKWATGQLPALVERHLPSLIAYDERAPKNLRTLLALPLSTNTTELLLRAVANHVDELRAPQILAIADAAATTLSADQLLAFAEWSVGRLEEKEVAPQPTLPGEPSDVLAAFLFALFGNVDKRKRWRAAHAARRIIGEGNQALLDALIGRLSSESGGAFVSANYPFFWLSARQWLAALLARIAADHPKMIGDHAPAVAAAALDQKLPHAAIRAMLKRAALSALEANGGSAHVDVSALQLANEPQSCFAERKSGSVGRRRAKARKELQFHFDSIDTLPYWYSPLGRVFGLSGEEIAEHAEPWIVKRLGFGNDQVWSDQRELSREGQYELVRNGHGSIPTIETLRTYLEYHGMLLTAGELVDNGRAILCEEWDGPAPHPWHDWLALHITAPNWWLADLRSTAPLEPFVYGALPETSEWKPPQAEAFGRHLIIERAGKRWLTAEARLWMWASGRHEHVSVRGALVAPEMARSLMRTFQTATNPHDFFLPYEGADEFSDGRKELSFGEFQLRGFLVEIRQERDTLEEHDPLRRINYAFDRPGTRFQGATNSAPDDTGLRLIARQALVAETNVWSDEIGDQRQSRTYERHTEGTRTLVPLEVMLQFLQAEDLDLIVEVQIDRKIDKEDRATREEYEPAVSRIYVIRGDGTIETTA